MSLPAIRNNLRKHQTPTPGKVVTESHRFPGHDNRMASHTHRVWNHACERTDGDRCGDCIYRRKTR